MGAIGGTSIPASIALSIEALGMPAMIPVFILAGVSGSYGLARRLLKLSREKRTTVLERLADRLAAHTADAIRHSSRRRLGRSFSPERPGR
jgi:hypothetical protein